MAMSPLRIAGIVCFISLIFAGGNSAAQKINISYSSLNGIQCPLWIAQDGGFFKKYRLDTQLVKVAGGETVVEEMLSGRVHLAVSAPGAVLRASQSGSDLVYVGALSDRIDYVVIAREEVNSARALRGRRIAIGRFGSGPDYASRIVFGKLGMRVGRDVFLTETFGGQPTRLAMLQRGVVDAIVLTPPHSLLANKLGFHTVLEYASVIPHFFSVGYFTRRKYVNEQPALYEGILRALMAATKYALTNGAGTLKILARYLKTSDATFLQSYYHDVLVPQLDPDMYPDPEGVDVLMQQERWANPKGGKVKPEDFIDTRILDKLLKHRS